MVWRKKAKSPLVEKNTKARLAHHKPVTSFVQMTEPIETSEERENCQIPSSCDDTKRRDIIAESDNTIWKFLGKISSTKNISRNEDDTVTTVQLDYGLMETHLNINLDSIQPQLVQARYLAEEGPSPIKLMVFLGGTAMILSCIFDFQAVGFHSVGFTVINFYAWCFGIFIAALEGKILWLDFPNLHRVISNYVKILRFMWGRGFFYMFVGSLMACLDGAFAGNICGMYMMSVGLLAFVFGIFFQIKLGQLLRHTSKEERIGDLFATYDLDKDGYLNREQFRDFTLNLKIVNLDQSIDFDAEFMHIDSDSDELITYDELKDWIDAVEYRNESVLTMFEDAAHYLV